MRFKDIISRKKRALKMGICEQDLLLIHFFFGNFLDIGKVFIFDDGSASAMIQFHDRKKYICKSTYLKIQLILKTIGVGNIRKALERETFIKNITPRSLLPTSGLWETSLKDREMGLVLRS